MENKNPRFSITVRPEIGNFLKKISKDTHKSVSGIVSELLSEAMDLREDFYLSKAGAESEKRAEGKPRIDAEILWKELGLN